jgi:hypothetical protein
MKSVVAEFVLHIQKNEKTAGDAKREPGDIDEREDLMPQDVSKGYDEIVSDHEVPKANTSLGIRI